MDEQSSRTPAIYLPHGGGPWPWMDPPLGGRAAMADLEHYLRSEAVMPIEAQRAVLMISSHWGEDVPTVMSSAQPPMLYDYTGFPPNTYEVKWPAPGAPEIAAQVRELLGAAGIDSGDDPERGFDHGTFVVMVLGDPEAYTPTFQLSLKRGLDPREHLAIGRALAPLRDQGVLILGSGMSYHNMQAFGAAMRGQPGTMAEDSREFHDWLEDAMAGDASQRETALVEWARAPKARQCHPREEHLLPLMVIAGAGEQDDAWIPFRAPVLGADVCAVQFGDVPDE